MHIKAGALRVCLQNPAATTDDTQPRTLEPTSPPEQLSPCHVSTPTPRAEFSLLFQLWVSGSKSKLLRDFYSLLRLWYQSLIRVFLAITQAGLDLGT